MASHSLLNSRFLTSPHFPKLKQVIDSNLGRIPKTTIYKYLKEIDPSLPAYPAFCVFLSKYDKTAKERRAILMKDINKDILSDSEVLDRGVSSALQLGNLAMADKLQSVRARLSEGETIPDKEITSIMRWFKDAGDLHFEGQTLKIKQASAMTDMAALALLSRSARAGNLAPSDIGMEDPLEASFEVVEETKNP